VSVIQQHSFQIKAFARNLGFEQVGISRAQPLHEDARRLEAWLNKGMHAGMKYMENHFDLRVDPTKLVPGARSVITLMMNYFPDEKQKTGVPKISKYAYGKDYHEVIRPRLQTLLSLIREHIGEVEGRGFVDSAPVLERSWAQRSGLGWVGKNGNLINRQNGSFFFIATLITDLELWPDDPYAKDYCGSCTKCIDACPTEAILPDKQIDANKCISYHTIELKDLFIGEHWKGKFDDWLFGCDTCQDVCPWNRFSSPTQNPAFSPIPEILNFSKSEWEEITEEKFRILFRQSPLKRTKWAGIQRNLKILSTESIDPETDADLDPV